MAPRPAAFLHNRNPQRRAADLVDLSAVAHFETHCRDRDPSRSHAGRNPCGSFEMLLYDNWVDAAARFKQNLEEEYDNREIASQIKFSMLQHQINPHFLYNTLDSVRGLAYAEGADSAAEMAEALAAFFRYSISHSDDIVSLGKELNNIKRYFVIQGYRFSKRFSLVVDISEDDIAIWGYPIPKLMIQPLVENAVFHGLEKNLEREA